MNRDLHTAGFHIDIGLILLTDSFQLILQNKRHDHTGNNANYKTDQKILTEVKRETIDIAVEIVTALISKRVKSCCVITVRQIRYNHITDAVDITTVNSLICF